MLNNFAIRRRFTRAYRLLLALTLTMATSGLARACTFSFSPDCNASGGGIRCSLLGLLKFLYAIAGVLAFVLIVVAALAVKSYRKNKQDEKTGL